MPEFLHGNSTAYLNPAPPLDPKGSSEYAVSPPPADWDAARVASYFREYDRPMLKILTIHEAYPGHYVQLEYSNRCPSLVRRVLSSGTFAEGWAVYTEQMMLDQGFGNGDLSLRLHQLKFYLLAIGQRDPRPRDARGADDRRRGHGAYDRAGLPVGGEAVGKVMRGEAVAPASSRLTSWAARRSTDSASRSSASTATASTSAATTRPRSPTARCR